MPTSVFVYGQRRRHGLLSELYAIWPPRRLQNWMVSLFPHVFIKEACVMRCIHADKLRQHNPLKKTGLHCSVALFFLGLLMSRNCVYFFFTYSSSKKGGSEIRYGKLSPSCRIFNIRRDTHKVAKRLIKKFGSYNGQIMDKEFFTRQKKPQSPYIPRTLG